MKSDGITSYIIDAPSNSSDVICFRVIFIMFRD